MKYLKKIIVGVVIILMCFYNFDVLNAKEYNKIAAHIQDDFFETDSDSGYVFRKHYPNGSYNNILKKRDIVLFGLETYPTEYDLRTIEDGAYLPSVRNQGSAELCWAFAMNSSLESFLKRHSIGEYENYNLSENQLDLALTHLYNNGMFGDEEKILGDSSNTVLGMIPWLLGYGPSTEDTFGQPYFDNYNGKNFEEKTYLDLSYSDINVNGMREYFYDTSQFEDNPLDYTDDLTTNLINPVKQQIIDNGAVMSSIFLPPSFPNTDPNFVYVTGYNAFTDTERLQKEFDYQGHSITIIGWDDNYGDIDNADGDNNVATGGEGAWIAQNSWGDVVTYFYISYYDIYVSINFYGITSAEVVSHDNTYFSFDMQFMDDSITDYFFIGDEDELVKEVKLYAYYSSPRNIALTITDEEGITCTSNTKSVLGGIYSFEFADCEVSGMVAVSSSNSFPDDLNFSYMTSLNTNNIEDSSLPQVYSLVIDGSGYIGDYINNKANKTIDIILSTKNTMSFDDYNIEIFGLEDEEEVNLTNKFTILKEALLNGYARVLLEQKIIIEDFPEIRVDFKYNNSSYVMDSFLLTNLDGEGTVENPFLIKHPEQLATMSSSHLVFELNNSINMEYITDSENGIYGERGWNPIEFGGEFNGNGYTISGLYSKGDAIDKNYVSLFKLLNGAIIYDFIIADSVFELAEYSSVITNSMINSQIDNVEIDNITVSSSLYSAGVVNIMANSTISNIKIKNSSISSSKYASGLLGTSLVINDNNTIISDNYIENTKIYSTFNEESEDFIPSNYFVNNITAIINKDEVLPSLVLINNYYLQTLEEGDVINASTEEMNIDSLVKDSEGVDVPEYDLYESVIQTSNNMLITEEESIIQDTFIGFDFDSIWNIDTEKSPRLMAFDLPDSLPSPSVEEIETFKIENDVLIVPPGQFIDDVIHGLNAPATMTKNIYNLDGTINKKTTPLPTGDLVVISNGYENMELELAVKGDINRDGNVSIADAMMIADYAVGSNARREELFTLKSHIYAADVIGETPLSITITDAMRVADYAVNNSLGL